MGCPVPVHCRQCNEALDVYEPLCRRFCSEECAAAYEEAKGNLVMRDENGKPTTVIDISRL
jgi:hypothetical protein